MFFLGQEKSYMIFAREVDRAMVIFVTQYTKDVDAMNFVTIYEAG
jgi:hypothetical protein